MRFILPTHTRIFFSAMTWLMYQMSWSIHAFIIHPTLSKAGSHLWESLPLLNKVNRQKLHGYHLLAAAGSGLLLHNAHEYKQMSMMHLLYQQVCQPSKVKWWQNMITILNILYKGYDDT